MTSHLTPVLAATLFGASCLLAQNIDPFGDAHKLPAFGRIILSGQIHNGWDESAWLDC